MNKANQLYWQAKSYKQKQQDIACDFVKECLEEFEKVATEGHFSTIIYPSNVPKSILLEFDELVLPFFSQEGFKVEEYNDYTYSGCGSNGWKISWNLKGEEIQYE